MAGGNILFFVEPTVWRYLRYFIYNKKLRKAGAPHTWEAGTVVCWWFNAFIHKPVDGVTSTLHELSPPVSELELACVMKLHRLSPHSQTPTATASGANTGRLEYTLPGSHSAYSTLSLLVLHFLLKWFFSSNNHALVGLYRGWHTHTHTHTDTHTAAPHSAVNTSRRHDGRLAARSIQGASGRLSESSLR